MGAGRGRGSAGHASRNRRPGCRSRAMGLGAVAGRRNASEGGRVDQVSDAVTAAVAWLDDANGRDQANVTFRILKVVEEAGEAAAAWIGAAGNNPRKGVTH